jgi:DNA topoisomerase-1
MKYLVIVESPAKREKIQSYLNAIGNGDSFIVLASMGHIRKFANGLKSIDMTDYTARYSVDSAKRKAVTELQTATKKADSVILATDPDREGEAIAFHLADVLGIKTEDCLRMTFNEITQTAIKRAFSNIGKLNTNLYSAQEARAILDLLIGYEISPVLWRYIQPRLSAGRCQSPALRLIYDREIEIESFKTAAYYQCYGVFPTLPNTRATYDGNRPVEPTTDTKKKKKASTSSSTMNPALESEDDIRHHLPLMMNTSYKLEHVSSKDTQSHPSAPYITSTIQQDASSKLGQNPRNTMRILQTLYEKGLITYMRTDSTVISESCHREIKEYIHEKHDGLYERRDYKRRVANAQEAHECIRPVKISTRSLSASFAPIEKKIYEMIWTRTVASQMKSSKEEQIGVQWKSSNYSFSAVFTRILFPGYKVLYESRMEDDSETINKLMALLKSSSISESPLEIGVEQKYTRPASRYTEASLIRELEERGIGRPSTFASIVSTLLERHYVHKDETSKETHTAKTFQLLKKSTQIAETSKEVTLESDRNKLSITPIGKSVCEFLTKHFHKTVQDYDFTKNIEENLDEISRGEMTKKQVIHKVYSEFHPIVEQLLEDKKQTRITSTNLTDDQKDSRSIIEQRPDKFTLIGKHTETKNPLYLHYGRYGPCIAELEESGSLRYYAIPPEKKNSKITLEEAIMITRFPRTIGKMDDGTTVLVKSGPYGFYIEYGSTRIPFSKLTVKLDPQTVQLSDLSEILEQGNAGTTVLKEYKDGVRIVKRNDYIYVQKSGKEAKWDGAEDAVGAVLKKTWLELLETNGSAMGKRRAFQRGGTGTGDAKKKKVTKVTKKKSDSE